MLCILSCFGHLSLCGPANSDLIIYIALSYLSRLGCILWSLYRSVPSSTTLICAALWNSGNSFTLGGWSLSQSPFFERWQPLSSLPPTATRDDTCLEASSPVKDVKERKKELACVCVRERERKRAADPILHLYTYQWHLGASSSSVIQMDKNSISWAAVWEE